MSDRRETNGMMKMATNVIEGKDTRPWFTRVVCPVSVVMCAVHGYLERTTSMKHTNIPYLLEKMLALHFPQFVRWESE